MMGISLFFSLNLYQLSVQEFDRGFRGPSTRAFSVSGSFTAGSPLPGQGAVVTQIPEDQIIDARETLFADARNRVMKRLVTINIVILIAGGILCYYLALRTLKPIEEAHASLERFTADASHELRTPIAAMQSEIEVALMNPKLSLKESKTLLQSNLEELAKLTALSEGLLRLARLENHELDMQKVSVDEIINQAIGRVSGLAEQKNILISSKIAKNLSVKADASSLQEALVTILDNAIKYSHERSEVKVTAKTDKQHVSIKIIDEGIGIKAGELVHIFDRFYRADTARSKQKIQGYGLGLAIAKNIIDLHKGSIVAKSEPGKGSTFTILLSHA